MEEFSAVFSEFVASVIDYDVLFDVQVAASVVHDIPLDEHARIQVAENVRDDEQRPSDDGRRSWPAGRSAN